MRLSFLTSHAVRLAVAATFVLASNTLAAYPEAVDTPQSAQAVAPTVDVTLNANGELRGYVVDGQGVPARQVEIELTTPAGDTVTATSDHKGRFGYTGLCGGAYQLETAKGVILCRAWTAKAAPPQSAATLLVVHDSTISRGQWSPAPEVNNFVGRMKRVMANPFAVATIVGASVAIPVAVHNANKDDSSS